MTSKERCVWMAWCDEDDGWIAALYGSFETKEQMESLIARERRDHENRRNEWTPVRPVLVTVNLESK